MNRRPGCFAIVWGAVFLIGGILVLVAQSVADTEPRTSSSYNDAHSFADIVTATWLVVLVVLAMIWLLAIVRRNDTGGT